MRTFTLMITVSAALMASLTGAALNSFMTKCEKEANGRGTSMGSKR